MSRWLGTILFVAVTSLIWVSLPQRVTAIAVQNGLIHYWPMNEASGSMVQDSIGGTNLQVQNGAQLGQPGIDGFGATLDGTNDFLISSPISLDFLGSDFTVSLWMRWSSASGKPGILAIGPWALDLTFSDLRPQLLISGQVGASSSQTIGDGKWHSLSVVRQGTSNLMYLDANLVGSGVGALTAPTSSGTLALGMYGGTHLFGGNIDDAAIFNRSLSSAEIAAIAIPGDFNINGVVDAADYVVWRKTSGPASDYDLWRAHIGQSLPGRGAAQSAPVPEPSSLAILGVLIGLASYAARK